MLRVCALGYLEDLLTREIYNLLRHHSFAIPGPRRADKWYVKKTAEGVKIGLLSQMASVPLLLGAMQLDWYTLLSCAGFGCLYMGLLGCAYIARVERQTVLVRCGAVKAASILRVVRILGAILSLSCLLALSLLSATRLLDWWGPREEVWTTCHQASCRSAELALRSENRAALRRFDTVSKLVGAQYSAQLRYGDRLNVETYLLSSESGMVRAMLMAVSLQLPVLELAPVAGLLTSFGAAIASMFFISTLILLRILFSDQYLPTHLVFQIGRIPEASVTFVFLNYGSLIATVITDETELGLCLAHVGWPLQFADSWDSFLNEGHTWVARILSSYADQGS